MIHYLCIYFCWWNKMDLQNKNTRGGSLHKTWRARKTSLREIPRDHCSFSQNHTLSDQLPETLWQVVWCVCVNERESEGCMGWMHLLVTVTVLWLWLCVWERQQDLLLKTTIWANYLCAVTFGSGGFSEMAQKAFPGSWHEDLHCLPISRASSVNLHWAKYVKQDFWYLFSYLELNERLKAPFLVCGYIL